MISSLGHHLNKPLLVSLPSIFDDGDPIVCILTGIEVSGLWLESRELAKKILHPNDKRVAVHIFVPFAQIACVMEPDPDMSHNRAPERQKAMEIEDKREKGTAQKKKRPA